MQESTMSSEKIWWIECGANLPNDRFTRNHMMTTDKVISFRYKYGNKGVFATAYMYDTEDQGTANLYGDFYLDFDYDIGDSEDKEASFDKIRKEVLAAIKYLRIVYNITNNDVKIFFSGSKGVHVILPKEVIGVEPSRHLNMAYRLMAEDIMKLTHATTIDLRIYDNRRLFRMPNSIHPKTDLYKIPLTYEELTTLTYESIITMAQGPRAEIITKPRLNAKSHMEYMTYVNKINAQLNKPKGTFTEVKLDYTPPCVEYLLNNPIGKGQRNDTLAFLASFLKQTGMEEQQTEATLLKWNDTMCSPSIPEREVTITVNSIYCGNGKMGCARGRILSRCDANTCKLAKKGI